VGQSAAWGKEARHSRPAAGVAITATTIKAHPSSGQSRKARMPGTESSQPVIQNALRMVPGMESTMNSCARSTTTSGAGQTTSKQTSAVAETNLSFPGWET